MTETYTYDAFGTLTYIRSLNEEGVLAQTDTALSRFLYAGEQYDEVTGLYYLRVRSYDTTVGRFTQEDTYLGDGRNLYVYVQNNPLKYVDPSGYGKKSLIEKVISFELKAIDKVVEVTAWAIAAGVDYSKGYIEAYLNNHTYDLWSTSDEDDIDNDLAYAAGRTHAEVGELVLDAIATVTSGGATLGAAVTTAMITVSGGVVACQQV